MHGWCVCALALACVAGCEALACYNCSSTHTDLGQCAGTFVKPPKYFNSSHLNLINCTDNDKSMCFVRAWSARATHSWIVQRGCYSIAPQDPLLQEMITPTRSMTCKHERLPDAEYTVCLCKSDWCNSARSIDCNTRRKYFGILCFSAMIEYFFHGR